MNAQYNLDKICRICMCEANSMIKIFGTVENISNILMACSAIIVTENDDLPKQICNACVNQANNARNFKQLCERSDNILRTYIKFRKNLIDNSKKENLETIYDNNDLFQNVFSDDLLPNKVCDGYFKETDIKLESQAKSEYSCEICGKICNSVRVLTQHILQDHTNNLTTNECPTCKLTLNEKTFAQHINVCGKKDLACNLCSEHFKQSACLEKHKESHCENGPHFCVHCNCFFLNHEYLLSHKNLQHHERVTNSNENLNQAKLHCKSFEGDTSDSTTIPENNKRQRGRPKLKQTQNSEKNLIDCSFCCEKFEKKIHLKRHIEIVHEDKVSTTEIHQCIECKKTFPKADLLRRHMKLHTVQNYTCDDCPKKFNKLEQLTEHRKRHTGERSYLCSKCGKGYFKQPHLDKHMLTHLNDHLEKPVYECTFCGKKLNHSNHLQVHMRTHRDRHGQPLVPQTPNPNKKVILCSVCGKSCSSRSNLAVHMRRHTGQMTNFCKICGKGYPRTTDLTLHMRKHTGEKPFVCSVCNRGFARSDKLAIHMRTHTGEKPYACTVCGRAFAQSNDLASHKRRNMCGQSNTISHNQNSQSSNIQPAQVMNISQINNSLRGVDVITSDIQRLERMPDVSAHGRAVELAQSTVHSRIEYTDYTTATLLQNLSNGHFMR